MIFGALPQLQGSILFACAVGRIGLGAFLPQSVVACRIYLLVGGIFFVWRICHLSF